MTNNINQKRNFVLVELGDNDFSTAMYDGLTQMHQSIKLDHTPVERMKDYLVQYMVAHTIISHAQVNEKIDWSKAKSTEEYLIKNLVVSTPAKIDFTKDYDSGAAYLDLRLAAVWHLNSSNYYP